MRTTILALVLAFAPTAALHRELPAQARTGGSSGLPRITTAPPAHDEPAGGASGPRGGAPGGFGCARDCARGRGDRAVRFFPWLAFGYASYATGWIEAAEEPRPAPRRPSASKVIDVAALTRAAELRIEVVRDGVLRLRGTVSGDAVRSVELYLADADERRLATQTVVAEPYSAVFDVTPRAAYGGMLTVGADGIRRTTLVPLPAKTTR
ncbi:MAG: hypothetical protein WKG32_06490 [Gemmatimonadaceae bacterium]